MNRRALKTEKLLSSSPSRKSALILRSWRPSKEVPKPRPGKVPKSALEGAGPKRGCRGKCRKSALGSVSLYYFHRETEPGALFRHFPRHPVSDRHLPEHFFGTFPGRGFGTSLDGRQGSQLLYKTGTENWAGRFGRKRCLTTQAGSGSLNLTIEAEITT